MTEKNLVWDRLQAKKHLKNGENDAVCTHLPACADA